MPCTEFICPDGATIPIDKCLKQCRMASRCANRAYLIKAADQRPWTGKPSVTQLENGPRLEFLRITKPYALSPTEDLAFALIGTIAHEGLEGVDDQSLNEQRLHSDITSGKFDNYVIENGVHILTDFKVYGAYAVKKVLDGTSTKEQRQMNCYRILLERHGHKVDEMWLDVIVRDGGTFTAKNMGITKKYYRIPIKKMPDDEINDWMKIRAAAILEPVKTNTVPRLCNAEESWDGRRCKDYCPVKTHCKNIGDNHWLKEKTK